MKAQKSKSESNRTYYSAGAVVAIGVLGVIGYYIYQSKTPKDQPNESPVHQPAGPMQALKETPDEFDME